jgi:hypothetical protein
MIVLRVPTQTRQEISSWGRSGIEDDMQIELQVKVDLAQGG